MILRIEQKNDIIGHHGNYLIKGIMSYVDNIFTRDSNN